MRFSSSPDRPVLDGVLRSIASACDSPDEWWPHRLREAALALREPDEPKDPPPGLNLDALADRLRRALRNDGTLDTLSSQDRRYSAFALFVPHDEPKSWVGAEARLRKSYIRWMANQPRMTNVARLLRSFLLTYPSRPKLRLLWADAIAELLDNPKRLSFHRLSLRASTYALLKTDGHILYAERLLTSGLSVRKFLDESGMDGALEVSGFLGLVHGCICNLLVRGEVSINMRDALSRILEFAELGGALRFGNQQSILANALLQPFLSETPPVSMKEDVREFILRHYRHPSVWEAEWEDVDRKCRELFRRWVAGATMEDFFELLRGSADRNEERCSECFWMAFEQAGFVDDAWVAIRRGALTVQVQKRPEIRSYYAEVVGDIGGQARKAALLLSVRGYIVVVWSGVTADCNVWRRGNRKAPDLGRGAYGPLDIDLAASDYSFRHDGSARGDWQDEAMGWFRKELGLNVPKKEYMPGG